MNQWSIYYYANGRRVYYTTTIYREHVAFLVTALLHVHSVQSVMVDRFFSPLKG